LQIGGCLSLLENLGYILGFCFVALME